MLKRFSAVSTLLFVFSFSAALLGNESAQKYFPSILGSYWVYEDQDGNELTRRAIEGEEIAGETYHAFEYEPELEDWADYIPFIHPFLYQFGDAGITLVVGDEVEKAVKARLTKEMEIFSKLAKNSLENNSPSEFDLTVNLNYDVEVEAENRFNFLPVQMVSDEEWDAIQISAKITMQYNIQGLPDFQGAPELPEVTLDFTILETGKILGTETVETEAGTFEDCLKVEYRTETTAIITSDPPPGQVNPPGETVTTVWYAPNVGIVKVKQKSGYLLLDMLPAEAGIPMPADPKEKTLELKKYEIKMDTAEVE